MWPLPQLTIGCHRAKVNVDDGFLNLMTQDGTAKDDVKIPESELGKQIQVDFEEGKDLMVTIISAMGEEQAISCVYVPVALVLVLTTLSLNSVKEAPKGS